MKVDFGGVERLKGHGERNKSRAYVSGSLPYAVDLCGHDGGRRARVPCSRRRALPRPLYRRHDLDTDRNRADPHDVSAVGEGEVRGDGARLPAPARPASFPGPELGGWTDPDVRARRASPARQTRVHDWPYPDRAGPLHRRGDIAKTFGKNRF